MTIRTGRYRHYKGQDYFVLGVARHSENQEEVVVYRQDYGDRRLWVRPLAMFQEMVTVEGKEVPRFRFVEAIEEQSRATAADFLSHARPRCEVHEGVHPDGQGCWDEDESAAERIA